MKTGNSFIRKKFRTLLVRQIVLKIDLLLLSPRKVISRFRKNYTFWDCHLSYPLQQY